VEVRTAHKAVSCVGGGLTGETARTLRKDSE
jgi:hypothetical protein